MNLAVGQLFVVGFDGLELPSTALKLISELNASGVVLFKRNIDSLEQVIRLNSQIVKLTAASHHPALISVDQEGGRVARLREICTPVPPMRELALMASNCQNSIYRTAAMMGRELSALGFHLDFAPVADVDSNKDNPVIGDRSFGEDQTLVGEMCAEFIKGLQSSGVAACAKHFPGHGDTHADSHIELPVLAHDIMRLRQCELIPFQKAIEAQVASVMTAHILLPAIDKVPATLSRYLLNDVLRSEMNFNGLIISDDLEMKGIADHYSLRETLLKGLLAGVDLFLICSDTAKAQEAITETQKLVDSGEVSQDRIQQSIARVQAFKKQYIGAVALPSLEYAQSIVRSRPHIELMERLS